MISRDRAVFICALLAACNGSSKDSAKPDPRESTGNKLSTGAATSSVDLKMQPTTPCPRTGRWALCSVEKRLEQAGFVVRPVAGEPPTRPGFSVTPAVYALAGMRLEVFIYPDEAALSRDIAKLDTVTVAPPGSPSPWKTETTLTFVRSGNLAAVFLSDNALQVERLTLALTAGAPQP
jgi:hypothetical protein